MAKKSLRVLSCVPKQLYKFQDKVDWVEQQAKTHRPDIINLPQEFFGGIQAIFFADRTDQKIAYSEKEITGPLLEIARCYNVGIVGGGLVDDPILNERRERIYVIDPERGISGFNDKFALPAYDHIDAKGQTKVFPETNLNNRAVAHECCGAVGKRRVSISGTLLPEPSPTPF